jgi:hypothetical protein
MNVIKNKYNSTYRLKIFCPGFRLFKKENSAYFFESQYINSNYNCNFNTNLFNIIQPIDYFNTYDLNYFKNKNKSLRENEFFHENKFKKSNFLFKFQKKNFSNSINLNNFAYLDNLPQNLNQLEEYQKKNSYYLDSIFSNRYYLFEDEKNFNYEIFTLSIYLNNFSDFTEKKKKLNNNILLEYFRNNNYSIINGKIFDKEKILKLIEILYMLKLSESDKEALFVFYFNEKNNKNLTNDDYKRLLNAIYFFDISGNGNKLTKIKKDLFETIKSNYKNLSADDVYYYNSNLIYFNSSVVGNLFKEISDKFSEIFETKEKKFNLINSINLNFNKISYEQKLMNFLLIPKLNSDSKNYYEKKQKFKFEKNQIQINQINSISNFNDFDTNLNFNHDEKILEKEIIIYEKNFEKNLRIFEYFLLEIIEKEEHNSYNSEILLSSISNYVNYLHKENPIKNFELIMEKFCKKIYLNLASLTNENYIELFFVLLNYSLLLNEVKFSSIKKILFIEVFKILIKIKSNEPRIFLEIDKFYLHLNSTRNILRNAFVEFNEMKEKENEKNKAILILNNKENFKDNLKNYNRQLDSFKKIVKLSIDLLPFSVKNKEYSSDLLNNQFMTFIKILESDINK